MQKKVLSAVALAAGLGLVAALPAHADIKIGLLTDFSGPQGAFGPLYKDGVDYFLKAHDGKIGGQTVQLLSEDGAGDPSTTIAKAKKLIESDKIDVLFGPINSATGAALKPYIIEQALRWPTC